MTLSRADKLLRCSRLGLKHHCHWIEDSIRISPENLGSLTYLTDTCSSFREVLEPVTTQRRPAKLVCADGFPKCQSLEYCIHMFKAFEPRTVLLSSRKCCIPQQGVDQYPWPPNDHEVLFPSSGKYHHFCGSPMVIPRKDLLITPQLLTKGIS